MSGLGRNLPLDVMRGMTVARDSGIVGMKRRLGLEARHDVVTFTSAPLEQDLTIAGDILAVVFASTDVKDTDWWVHVSDVDQAIG